VLAQGNGQQDTPDRWVATATLTCVLLQLLAGFGVEQCQGNRLQHSVSSLLEDQIWQDQEQRFLKKALIKGLYILLHLAYHQRLLSLLPTSQ